MAYDKDFYDLATKIKSKIDESKKILLHCHPSPDPDSLGSALALKEALLSMGKKAEVISGDSPLRLSLKNMPGAEGVLDKSFGEVSLEDFDLFISLDSANPNMVSKINTPIFLLKIPTIVIDHHDTNSLYGDINLIDKESIATAQTLFYLFKYWGIGITKTMSLNLFAGLVSDSGGFVYSKTTDMTLEVAREMYSINKDIPKEIIPILNSNEPRDIKLTAVLLKNTREYISGKVAISSTNFDEIKDLGFDSEEITSFMTTNIIKTVSSWVLTAILIEVKPGDIKSSLRTSDTTGKIDVSLIAKKLGGGGHKMAAGSRSKMSLDEAVKTIVEEAQIQLS